MPNEKKTKKVYLGDGVYAQLDGFGGVVLTTEDGEFTTNTIVLEYQVAVALMQFIQQA